MSATSSPAQSLPTSDVNAAPVSVTEIDASCRGPVMVMFVSAAVWLFISSVLEMIASLKFHAPNILADCPIFTYGRVYPAHINALTYGFAMQAGLGVVAWMLAHLGKTRLAFGTVITFGAVLWNLGVTLGVLGILGGESTGYEWLEMPRYAAALLFLGYVLIGIGAMVTFHERRERVIYTSQFLAVAAIFWFPWIYSTAELLLVAHPVRGALQAEIGWWYANNLKTVWFGFVGLAAIFYFVPKIVEKPLYSHYIGIFIFWTLALFGSWGGVPHGAPLPAWLAAMSTMGAVMTIVPVLAAGINVFKTKADDCSKKMRECRTFKFFLFGTAAYVVSGLLAAFASLMKVGRFTNFTWFVPAEAQLILYGFFAISILGAIYYIVPRVLGVEFPKPGMICLNFLLAGGGILLYSVLLIIGGVMQGVDMNDPSVPFIEIMHTGMNFFKFSTLGDFLMLLGHLVLLLNLAGILCRFGRPVLESAKTNYIKPAEVTP